MNIEDFREYCLSLPAVTEEFPFGIDTLVYKVAGKIFAISALDSADFKVNLKYDPELIDDLRDEYPEIQPGYHMNKKHWNTVDFQGKLTEKFLKELILHSYQQVIKNLSKKIKTEFNL